MEEKSQKRERLINILLGFWLFYTFLHSMGILMHAFSLCLPYCPCTSFQSFFHTHLCILFYYHFFWQTRKLQLSLPIYCQTCGFLLEHCEPGVNSLLENCVVEENWKFLKWKEKKSGFLRYSYWKFGDGKYTC